MLDEVGCDMLMEVEGKSVWLFMRFGRSIRYGPEDFD